MFVHKKGTFTTFVHKKGTFTTFVDKIFGATQTRKLDV